MRIKSKLLAIYIPILLIGMTLIGYWAYLTAYESVREREYKLLTQTLSLTFVELVEERHKLLVDSGLENVPMFREAYQKEVFDELDALHLSTDKHFTVSEKSTGQLIYTSQQNWSPLDISEANRQTINNKKVAFGETTMGSEEILFACSEFFQQINTSR